MKKSYFLGAILSVSIIMMLFFNPGQDEYVSWVAERIKEDRGILVQIGVDYVAKPVISTSTTKKNYLFFTVYHTNLVSDANMITLGIMDRFIPIKSIDINK